MSLLDASAPKPRQLIFNLVLASENRTLTARDALNACLLFGIRESAVRVALVRMAAEGLLQSAGRGSYCPGPNATGLAEQLSGWREGEGAVIPWSGSWLMAGCGHLGRSDRAALRERERVLSLFGFRELAEGHYLRPDNLAGGVGPLRDRLQGLGLDPKALVFAASDLGGAVEAKARGLWKGAALDEGYRRLRLRLEEWLARRDGLPAEAAVREAYLLGNDAVKSFAFDPLLPAPLVDVEARRAAREATLRFVEIGHSLWRHYLEALP